MRSPLRFVHKPGTMAYMMGLSVGAVAVRLVLDKFLPGADPATTMTAGAVAADGALEWTRRLAEPLFTNLSSLAINVHSADLADEERTGELAHHREFNFDLQLAVGRALAETMLAWPSAKDNSTLTALAEAVAEKTEGTGKDRRPAWITAAESVEVDLKEETLRDLCLNHGEMPAGTPFLDPGSWVRLLGALAALAGTPDDLRGYDKLWSALAGHMEAEFPRRFYHGLKHALSDEKHRAAWAAMQYGIDALIVKTVREAASLAGEAARGAAGARGQSALTHEAVLRLTSQIAADMRALWQRIDDSDSAALGSALDEVRKTLDEMRDDARTAAGAALRGVEIGEELRVLGQQQAKLLVPVVTLPLPSRNDRQNRFRYDAEWLDVVGRDTELAELNRWLDRDQPFGWDLWTGPAGAGKSRLALHLCRRRADWRRGFFQWGQNSEAVWRLWAPEENTLIIFDYVAEHAKEIGDALSSLARRVTAPDASHPPLPEGVKVRCLLLERAAARVDDATGLALWYEGILVFDPAEKPQADKKDMAQLEAPWIGVLRSAAKEAGPCHARWDDAEPGAALDRADVRERYLGGVPPGAVREIVAREDLRAREKGEAGYAEPTVEQIGERIIAAQRIDPHARPLFVAMAAEAVREKGGSFELTDGESGMDALVEHINKKEWGHATERLKANGGGQGASIEAWEKLVCLATMCRGLSDKTLADALDSPGLGEMPTKAHWGGGERYSLLVSGAGRTFAPPLEPDVLGEAFVLAWLEGHPFEKENMIARAWELGMGEFVSRAAQNFPDKVERVGLLEPRAGANADALAEAHTALGAREWVRGDMAAVAARGRKLAEGTGQPARVRARGLFMWMDDKADAAALDALLGVAQAFSADELSDKATRADLARALFNAFNDAKGDAGREKELLKELRDLRKEHKEDAAVREWLASALFNAFNNAKRGTEPEKEILQRQNELLDELRALRSDHQDDAAVRGILARALFNAFNNAKRGTEREKELLDELRDLRSEHKDDAAVREWLASALFNAFNNAKRGTEREKELLDELRALRRDHQDDAAVREWLARALLNTFVYAENDTGREKASYDELLGLAREYESDSAVAFPAFRACALAFDRGVEAGRLRLPVLDDAEELAPRLPVDEENATFAAMLLKLVLDTAKKAEGTAQAALIDALNRLGVACEARFGPRFWERLQHRPDGPGPGE